MLNGLMLKAFLWAQKWTRMPTVTISSNIVPEVLFGAISQEKKVRCKNWKGNLKL